jgi:hypothetical protein
MVQHLTLEGDGEKNKQVPHFFFARIRLFPNLFFDKSNPVVHSIGLVKTFQFLVTLIQGKVYLGKCKKLLRTLNFKP